MKLVSTIITEIFNANNVRIGYPPECQNISIQEKNDDIYVMAVAPSTGNPVPINIPIVDTGCNFLAIYTSAPVTAYVNDPAYPASPTGVGLTIGVGNGGGHFVLLGQNINSLTLMNSDQTVTPQVQIIVGNVNII